MVRDQLLNYNSHAQGKIMDKKSVNKVILIGNIGNMPNMTSLFQRYPWHDELLFLHHVIG